MKELDEAREKIRAEYVRFNHQLIPMTARANATGHFAEIEAAEEKFYDQILSLKGDGWSIAIIGTDPERSYAKHGVEGYSPVIWEAGDKE